MGNKLSEIESLLKRNAPQDVDEPSVERASKLVRVVLEVQRLQEAANKEVEDNLRPIRREIRQHQRQLSKMFSSVLPEQKKSSRTKEKYLHLGLKNWMVEYGQKWAAAGYTQTPASLEQLRKVVGEYNKKAFTNKINSLTDNQLLKKTEIGKYLVQDLPQEVLS